MRSFSWLILLGDNGLINKMLMRLGVIAAPLALLYTTASVLVAMIQILLPLATIVLFGAMLRIDRTLLAAAKIHGASEWQAFRTVFLPLSLPGVYGAGLLVFVLVARLLRDAGAAGEPARDHDRADHHGRSKPAARLVAGERRRRRAPPHHARPSPRSTTAISAWTGSGAELINEHHLDSGLAA